jgi:hypothetical protein
MNAGAMVAIMAANAAAAAAAAQQRQLDAFRVAGATAPERAQRPETIGLSRDDTFERLMQEGVLRDAGDGRVWLDEAALIARRRVRSPRSTRIAVVIGLLVAVLLVGLAVLLMARSGGAPPGGGELS